MKNIIIFLIAIFFTQNLYASDSIVYDVYKDLINIIKQFSLNIHSGLILIYSKFLGKGDFNMQKMYQY